MKRQELLNALQKTLAGTDTHSVAIEGAETFVFDKTFVRTYNDSISVSFPVKTGVTASVKAQELLKIVSKMSGEDIELVEKKNKLIIKDERTNVEMVSHEMEEIMTCIHDLKLEDIKKWKSLPEDFHKGLSLVLPSASRDISKGVLNGVFVTKAYMYTSDDFRVSRYSLDGAFDGEVIIPYNSCVEIVKLSDLEKFSINDSWIHFKNKDGAIFSSRLLGGTYPAVEIENMKAFKLKQVKPFTLPDDFANTVDRVSVLGNMSIGDESYVDVKMDSSKIVCSGSREIGSIEEVIKIKRGDMPEAHLKISCQYLQSILQVTKNFFVDEQFVVFVSDNFRHLMTTISE